MSGPSDLARLTVTIDKVDEIFLSPEIKDVDVGNGETRPTVAKALSIAATQLGGSMPWPSVAIALENTVNGAFFSVPSAEPLKYVDMYRNDDGAAVYVDSYPSAEAVDSISKLIGTGDGEIEEELIQEVTNNEGEVRTTQTNKSLTAPSFKITAADGVTTLGDDEGNVVVHADKHGFIFGEMEMVATDAPGWYIANDEGEVLVDLSGTATTETVETDPFAEGLLFAPTLVTAEGYEQVLYAQNLLPRRQLVSKVVCSLASTVTGKSDSGSVLKIAPGVYGAAAVLNLRNANFPNSRRFMNLSIKNVPIQTATISPKILLLGDSILNRQGGVLIAQVLHTLGITPTFIGTMLGSASESNPGLSNGTLGEAREGWESGDYTNAVTDRALILAPGDEAAYLAMSKADQRDRNVFARAATGADPVGIVRNGYVFDPAFYQSRFSLDTPDIVLCNQGTNDTRDRSASEIYAAVLANETIINSQIRAAWPNAKIIRFLPGTASNDERNALWTSHYLPVIRAIQKSAESLADAKLTIAPTWALSNPEVGYAFTPGAAGVDGFYNANWNDPIHPIQAARLALFQCVSAYVAAAAIGII